MNNRLRNSNKGRTAPNMGGMSPFNKLIVVLVSVLLVTVMVIALLVNVHTRITSPETDEPTSESTDKPSDPADSGTEQPDTDTEAPITTEAPETESETTLPEATTETPETKYDPDQKLVAFSFDDGPHLEYTLDVLEVLKKYNATATFFVIGQNCTREGAAEVMQKTLAAGHEIASHTYTHPTLTKLTADQIREEEQKTADIIYKNCGVYPTMMRAPGGAYNDAVLATVSYPLIRWSVDTLDWEHNDPQKTLELLKENVTDGGIVLMHDRKSNTAEATELCLEWLYANGYKVVSVSELMEAKGVTMEEGKVYFTSYRVDPKE